MSKTIDERVVSMQFDNKHFESNVKTSMSTLDKLKKSLKFDSASKGFDNVSKAAKKVDMTGLGDAVDKVKTKFSALDVMGVTALANITNSAVNAGKKIISALTIDPVMTGFKEYETQINAVQTILANTQSKGTTIDDVNKALDTLNAYADKTIYNFTEMTRNIGTFTAAGVDLETSVNAIQGIANLAAVSGSTSQQASTAMYQLSQALSSGTVKLMDWNSVVNAGMGGQVFQDALKETARVHGIAIDSMIKEQGSFRETLSEGWLTSEILTETLMKFTLTTEGLTEAQIEENRAMLKAKGYTDDQIKAIFKLGKTSTDAATKVKTFTQLWDVLKEAAQSGWTQTWELIVGDFDEAKSLLTPLSEFLTGFINKMSEWRNTLLEGALGSPFEALGKKLKSITGISDKTTNKVKKLGNVVDKVMNGDFGNIDSGRIEKLTKAGYDFATVQNLVNERLGSSVRRSSELTDAQEKLAETRATNVEQLLKLSDAELKKVGLTNDDIEALRELEKQSERTGIPIQELIDDMSKLDGRTLLIESLKNVGSSLVKIFTAIGDAWRNTFDPVTSNQLYNIITAIHKFSLNLKMTDETAAKLQKTFEGVFAILDIVTTVLGGPLKIAFKLFIKILDAFDLGILDVTASISEAIIGFNDWLDSLLDFEEIWDKISPFFDKVSEGIRKCVDSIKSLDFIGPIKGWFSGLKEAENIPKYILLGLVNGLRSGAEAVWNAIVNIGKTIIEKFCSIFGINSPSTVFFAIGGFIIAGLVNGISDGAGNVWNAIKSLFSGIIDRIKNMDFSVISALMWGISAVIPKAGVFNLIAAVTNIMAVLGDKILSTIKDILGINSPSTEFFEIGKNVIQGFVNGLMESPSALWDAIKPKIMYLIDMVRNVDFSKIAAGLWVVAEMLPQVKVLKLIRAVANLMAVMGNTILDSIKNVLGIHSPSTKFFEIGQNIIQGLVNGIKTGVSIVFETIKTIGLQCIEIIKKIDFGAILAAIVSLGIVRATNKIGDALEGFSAPFKGVKGVLDSVSEVIGESAVGIAKSIKSFSKVLKSIAFENKANGIKTLATSLLLLVGAIAILTLLDVGKVWNAVGVILALSVILGVLAFAMGQMSKASATIDKNGISVKNITANLASMGIAILLLGLTVKLIGSMNPEQAKQGFLGLAGIVGAMVVVIGTFGLLVKGESAANISKLGSMLRKMALSLLMLVTVVKLVSKLDGDEMIKGGIFVGAFIVFTAALGKIASMSGDSIGKLGGMMLKISLALMLMIGVVKLTATLKSSELGSAIGFLTLFTVFVFALNLATRGLNGSDIKGLGSTLFAISTSLLLMAGVVKILGGLSIEELLKGGTAIAVFSTIIGILITSIQRHGSDAPKVAGTLAAFATAIAMLAAVTIVMSLMNPAGLAKGLIVVGILSAMMTGLIIATRGATDIKGSLIAMTVAIGLMAAAIVALSFIDASKLAAATGSMGVLMGMFALMIKATSTAKNAMGSLIVLTSTIIILGGVLYLLSLLPIETTFGVAASLSLLVVALSASLLLLSGIGKFTKDALLGVLALTAMVIPLLAFVGVLALMQNIQNATSNTMALTALATVLTLLLIPLSLVGALVMASAGGILLGIAALLAMAIPLVAFIGVLALMQNIQNATENTNLLIGLMTTMTDMLIKLSIIAPLALMGVAAMTGLTILMVEIGALAVGIGALMEKFPALEDFLNTGIPIMEKLAHGIGSMIGNFIGGFSAGITSGLPEIGANLSMFVTNAMPFINGIKMVDSTVLANVGYLSGAILALTAADLIAGISSFIQGGSSFAALGMDLSQFMLYAQPFITGAANVSAEMVAGVKSIAETILILTAADVLQGLTSWFTGGTSLSSFAAELPALGTGLAGLINNIGTFTDAQLTTVNCAANAIKTIAQAASEIPNSGGWVGAIVGENDLGMFALQFPLLGTGLARFASNVGTFTDDQVKTVKCAANAVKSLATAASEIPNSGGWVGAIVGENDLSTFASQFPSVGTGLAGFVSNVGTFTDEQAATVKCGADAIKTLAEASTKIPNEGGWLAKIVGDNSLSTFGSHLAGLGKNLRGFVDGLGTFTDAQVTTVKSAVQAIKALATLANADLSGAKSDLSGFGEKIVMLGKKVGEFCKNMPAESTISSATNGLKNVLAAVKEISSGNASSIKEFADSLKKLGKDSVDKFVQAFTGSSAQTEVKTASAKLLESAIEGLESKKKALTDACKELATDGAEAIEDKKSSFKTAGKYVVSGFAEGISENTFKAEAKARAMAKAALEAAEDELGIQSPSKEFESVGVWSVMGFTKALGDGMTDAENAGEELGDAAVDGTKGAFGISGSTISDWIDNNILNKKDEAEEAGEEVGDAVVEGIENALSGGTVSNTYQDAINQIEEDKYYDRLDLAGELAAYKNLQAQYATGTEERKKIDREVYRLEKELSDATYQSQIDQLNERKELGELTLIEELSAYKRLQTEYEEGSDKRIEIDKKVYDIEKQITDSTEQLYKDIDQTHKDATDRKIAREKEYLEACKDVNDRLKDDIKSVNDEYESSLKAKADALNDPNGIFSSVDNETVSGDTLMKNLQDQYNELNTWHNNITMLMAKGVDEALLTQLREMGPSASAEIQGLVSMSDEKLDEYVALWRAKTSLASDIATKELRSTYIDTQKEIKDLNDAAQKELKELETEYNNDLANIDKETGEQLANLRQTWLDNLGFMKEESKSEFTTMTNELIAIVGEQHQWNDAGANMINGLIQGLEVNSGTLTATITEMMKEALETAKETLGIASPSKEFAKIGKYADLGLVVGLNKFNGEVYDSAASVGNLALDGLKSSISRINDVVNGDMDMQPTIRPVLDLSEVRAGASALGGMLDVGASAHIGTISSMMNRYRQNGANDDVVSAIDKLRDIIGNSDRATYNINGISYGEGSEVAEAIETIVRAARMERRV